jgi:aminoglycoside phosphotransferase (APT) family kinase protein
MERRHGFVIRTEMPPEMGDDLHKRQQVSLATVDALATLHAVDWQAVGLQTFGRPEGYLERQLRRWPEQWARAKTRQLPALDRVCTWLQQHRPVSSSVSIVHGDYKLDNLLFDAADPSRVTAILDWEMATLGDPLADLGWLLSYWPQPDDSVERLAGWSVVTVEPGFLSRQEMVARYEEHTKRRARGIDFYEIFGLYKNAVIIEGIYARFVAAQTQDERFADFGKRVEMFATAAWELTHKARL